MVWWLENFKERDDTTERLRKAWIQTERQTINNNNNKINSIGENVLWYWELVISV